mmetsp:Transcript_12854/g.37721  ORF Transcript_12854/g.37721 Transcript_12854/m.37721 type:complete len:132 (+) Transcript_12854:125-520(+)
MTSCAINAGGRAIMCSFSDAERRRDRFGSASARARYDPLPPSRARRSLARDLSRGSGHRARWRRRRDDKIRFDPPPAPSAHRALLVTDGWLWWSSESRHDVGGWARRARRALSQLHALQCGPRDEQGFSSQ